MGEPIPLQLAGTAPASPSIEIDGTLVARGLGLEVEAFRRLMDGRRIRVLCERGTGDDTGLYRATFDHGGRRVRLVVDGNGTVLDHGGMPPGGGVPSRSPKGRTAHDRPDSNVRGAR